MKPGEVFIPRETFGAQLIPPATAQFPLNYDRGARTN